MLLQAVQAAAAHAAAQTHAATLAQLQASLNDKESKMREAFARQARTFLASSISSVFLKCLWRPPGTLFKVVYI